MCVTDGWLVCECAIPLMLLVIIVDCSWSLKGLTAGLVLLNWVGECRGHVKAGNRLDVIVHECSADFPVDTNCSAVESKGSLVIIILLLLHSSPDGPHLSIPTPSSSPSLFPHIHVFISFPSPPDFVSMRRRREQRKGDSQKHREIEKSKQWQEYDRNKHKWKEGCKQKEKTKKWVWKPL